MTGNITSSVEKDLFPVRQVMFSKYKAFKSQEEDVVVDK